MIVPALPRPSSSFNLLLPSLHADISPNLNLMYAEVLNAVADAT